MTVDRKPRPNHRLYIETLRRMTPNERRRLEADIVGTSMYISTPEDTILAKLNWAQEAGGSEKQFTDALRVCEVQAGALDMDYLHDWAERLGVGDLWRRLLEAGRTDWCASCEDEWKGWADQSSER